VNESQLSATDRDKFNFQKDMHFSSKNKKEATVYLNKVVNSKEYGSQANIILVLLLMKVMIIRKLQIL
jgi:hypothetical protein